MEDKKSFLPEWLQGEFQAVFTSQKGEVKVEWRIELEKGLFWYRERAAIEGNQLWLSRVLGRIQVEEVEGKDWVVIFLVRGRERAKLLARRVEGGVELVPLASQPNHLLVLPIAGRILLTTR